MRHRAVFCKRCENYRIKRSVLSKKSNHKKPGLKQNLENSARELHSDLEFNRNDLKSIMPFWKSIATKKGV